MTKKGLSSSLGDLITVPIPKIVEDDKLVNLDDRSSAIFVGDTHGDLEASKSLWEKYGSDVANGEAYLVFLGDYVDRGDKSKENIDFLLSKKKENPSGLILLLGNHDAYNKKKLRPVNFWPNLSDTEYDYYKELMHLPWVAKADGLIASHGALPFVSDLGHLVDLDEPFDRENDLEMPIWQSVTWGDLNSRISGVQMDGLTGRPQFGKEKIMEYLQKHDCNVLIRAHQPKKQGWSFSGYALTIFTSQAYVDNNRAYERNVAVVDLENRVDGKEDIEVLGLEEL